MSSARERGMGAEISIGVLLCAAAYWFMTEPLARSADAARDRVETLTAQGYGVGDEVAPTREDYQQRARKIAAAAHAADELGRAAFNESRMLGEWTALATKHGLVLDQLQPGARSEVTVAADSMSDAQARDAETRYTFTVRGEYARIVEFLREFGSSQPLSLVIGVRVASSQEPDGPPVSAIVTTRHFVFDAKPAVRMAEAAMGMSE